MCHAAAVERKAQTPHVQEERRGKEEHCLSGVCCSGRSCGKRAVWKSGAWRALPLGIDDGKEISGEDSRRLRRRCKPWRGVGWTEGDSGGRFGSSQIEATCPSTAGGVRRFRFSQDCIPELLPNNLRLPSSPLCQGVNLLLFPEMVLVTEVSARTGEELSVEFKSRKIIPKDENSGRAAPLSPHFRFSFTLLLPRSSRNPSPLPGGTGCVSRDGGWAMERREGESSRIWRWRHAPSAEKKKLCVAQPSRCFPTPTSGRSIPTPLKPFCLEEPLRSSATHTQPPDRRSSSFIPR